MKMLVALCLTFLLAAAFAAPYTTFEYLYAPGYYNPVVRSGLYPYISTPYYSPYFFDGAEKK